MKFIYSFVVLLLTMSMLSAQVPNGFNYQAVVRNDNNELLANQEVTFKISIIDDSNIYYSETHSATTNENGLVNLVIGQGDAFTGDFENAFNTDNQKSIKIEIDIEGGTNFSLLGTSLLWSVPYATKADKADYAENIDPNQLIWSKFGNNTYYNDGFVGIGTNAPGHHLEINVNSNGDDGINRQFISIRNINNSSKSYSALGLASGTDANKSDGALGVTAQSYTAIPDLGGMTYLVNNENGVAIRASGTTGKLKFWTGGNGSTYERMTIASDGNVGIDNINPNYLLDVNGTVNASEYLIDGNPLSTSQWTTNSSNIYYNNGYVGIGTDNPDRSLQINIDTDGTNGFRSGMIMKNLDNSSSSIMDAVIKSGTDSNEAGGGIGTSALSYTSISDFAGYTYVYNVNSGVALKARNASGKIRFYTGGDDLVNERMTIASDGNVGIDNNNPNYLLDVNGTVNASEYLIDGNPLSTSQWTTNSNNIYYNNGYVGIGTDTPGHHLEINVDANGDDGINRQFISIRNINNSSKSYSALGLASGTDTNKSDGAVGVTAQSYTAIPDLGGMTYLVNNENGVAIRASGTTGKLKFWTGGDGSTYERMTIASDGNIGIDNIDPQTKLQVSNGDVYIDDIGSGVIMKSPDGNCWRMTVDNSGNPVFSSIACPN